MQTSPWAPRPQSKTTWWMTFVWYIAGALATVATALVVGGIGDAAPRLAFLALYGVGGSAIVAGALWSRRLARRDCIALWLGAATPIVVAAVAIGLLILAWANSDWTF